MKLQLTCTFTKHDPNQPDYITYQIARHDDKVILGQIETSERTQGERVKTVYLSRCIYGEEDHLDHVFRLMHLAISWKAFDTFIDVPNVRSVI
jgi:hypothetical protein